MTAYDVAIGSGKGSSDPNFYKYLCAVADWRIQKNPLKKRAGVLLWQKFEATYADYFVSEPEWRRNLIEDNSEYYSSGVLPEGLPVLPEGLPADVLSELKA